MKRGRQAPSRGRLKGQSPKLRHRLGVEQGCSGGGGCAKSHFKGRELFPGNYRSPAPSPHPCSPGSAKARALPPCPHPAAPPGSRPAAAPRFLPLRPCGTHRSVRPSFWAASSAVRGSGQERGKKGSADRLRVPEGDLKPRRKRAVTQEMNSRSSTPGVGRPTQRGVTQGGLCRAS